MSKARFTIGQLGRACEQGGHEAGRLFERGKQYQLADTFEAGASPENIVWLLLKRSKECPATLDIMKKWARACCKDVGVKPKLVIKSGQDCFAVVKDATRAFTRKQGTSRGAKAWAINQLRAVAEAERE